MKKVTALLIAIILIMSTSLVYAGNSVAEYMELSVTGNWSIFTKNMEDAELLAAVGKSTEDINKILADAGSESVIINRETGDQVYLKISKNPLSQELWNISTADNTYILKEVNKIFREGFLMEDFNYQAETVSVVDYAYMKFITASGSTYQNDDVHGVVCGGSFVNGNAIVFTMITEEQEPTAEEIAAVQEIASGVSFTVLTEKSEEDNQYANTPKNNMTQYIWGGFGALVIIIFCGYMIEKMRSGKKEEAEEITDDKEETDQKEIAE